MDWVTHLKHSSKRWGQLTHCLGYICWPQCSSGRLRLDMFVNSLRKYISVTTSKMDIHGRNAVRKEL